MLRSFSACCYSALSLRKVQKSLWLPLKSDVIFVVVNSRTSQFPFSFRELSSLGIPILFLLTLCRLQHKKFWSPHLRHILLLLLILIPILWWLIQRAGAPTVPAAASTLAPFGLEDHQVPSNSL
ncbi:hypothetical protein PVK06_017377 [Gossypium arboreum]|uniref:Uncharacterized protein n=1 Tax=Gossypium arboreum TaxID=29729 RepID=A0ABR0Q2U2_GOSAR|nr:hypothetical protein PVK06_017377 [Gossypium arboreum]